MSQIYIGILRTQTNYHKQILSECIQQEINKDFFVFLISNDQCVQIYSHHSEIKTLKDFNMMAAVKEIVQKEGGGM